MAGKELTLTINTGRVSYPTWDHATAVQRNAKSKFPESDPTKIAPEFNLLIEQPMLDKVVTHLTDVFLPFCLAQNKAGVPAGKNSFEQREYDKLMRQLEAGDWLDQPPYIPIKPVPDKTLEMAPGAVASLKIKGLRNQDIELKALVNGEDELSDPTIIFNGRAAYPIRQTIYDMYAGCYVGTTVNLYGFMSGKLPGYSMSAGIVVFKADGDRLGGGMEMDLDEISMD